MVEVFWHLVTATGATFALTFIIALALGINALVVLFLGSSASVLERFSRVSQSPRTRIGVIVAWSGCVAALGGRLWREADPTQELSKIVFGSYGVALLSVSVLTTLVYGLLRKLSARVVGWCGLLTPSLGYTLLIGGGQQWMLAASPLLISILLALALWLRRWRKGASRSTFEVLVLTLCGVFSIGVVLALALAQPSPNASGFGLLLILIFLALLLLGLMPLAIAGFLDLRGSAEWFVAVRYLFAKRRQTFISLITLICVAGVTAGVWLIITVLSVMNGFERTWRDEIIGNRAHFTVHSWTGDIPNYLETMEKIRRVPEVLGTSPYLDAEGMVRGRNGEVVAVRVRGIDPALVSNVTNLREDIVAGSLDDLGVAADAEGLEVPGILVGSKLAASLGVTVGDSLRLISPFGGPPTPFGPAPRLKPFRVAGIFETSFFQYDEMFTYVSLAAAQDFLKVDDVVQGVEVRVTDLYRSQAVARTVREALRGEVYTRDWKEYFPAFFQALKTERIMMFFLLTMIMVVAAFVIVATLVMMIMEKTSDIAILKAMGAEDAAIERIFAIEGTLIGLVGTAVGVVAGIAVTTQLGWVQKQIETVLQIDVLPADVYQLSNLPWEINPIQILVIMTIAMVLSLGATLLPSRQGARIDPAEALRYE